MSAQREPNDWRREKTECATHVMRAGCPRSQLFRNRNPLRPSGFHSTICSPGHYVVTKSAIGVQAFLLNNHFVAQKRHGDLAFRTFARNESRNVATDRCF